MLSLCLAVRHVSWWRSLESHTNKDSAPNYGESQCNRLFFLFWIYISAITVIPKSLFLFNEYFFPNYSGFNSKCLKVLQDLHTINTESFLQDKIRRSKLEHGIVYTAIWKEVEMLAKSPSPILEVTRSHVCYRKELTGPNWIAVILSAFTSPWVYGQIIDQLHWVFCGSIRSSDFNQLFCGL